MSTQQSEHHSRIEELRVYLRDQGYNPTVRRHYLPIARRFLRYLDDHNRSIETALPADLDGFLRRERRVYRKRNGRAPSRILEWNRHHASPPRLLLRLVHGRWPRELPPVTQREVFHREMLEGYDWWMGELRGLATVTRDEHIARARELLDGLGERSDPELLENLGVREIDAYIAHRVEGLRRKSIKTLTACLRVFLRYLHGSGRTARDLSLSVTSPVLYAYEGIPSALQPEDVQNVLAMTREDRTIAGRRDYAILMLLATYGLRAGEITTLRLDDIDWRKDVLRVRHSKTGAHSTLPLLPEPGEALLAYLRDARPQTALREIFLCLKAPLRPFRDGSALYSTIRDRLTRAGVRRAGKKGPHAFRHYVSRLTRSGRSSVSSDFLGNRAFVPVEPASITRHSFPASQVL
jgi:integrase/recombinase XerD